MIADFPTSTDNAARHAADVGEFLERLECELDCYHGPDRRSESRRRLIVPVLAMPVDQSRKASGAVFQAITRDISDSGIGLLTIRSVTTPQLGLLFQARNADEMMVLVDVTRCRRIGIYYEVGGRFRGVLERSNLEFENQIHRA